MGTPTFSYGPSHKIIEQMGGWPDEEIVFVLDSQITTDEADVDLTVYTFPQVRDLVELVQEIDADTDVKEDAIADESFMD
jgi:chemotaxis protein CheC